MTDKPAMTEIDKLKLAAEIAYVAGYREARRGGRDDPDAQCKFSREVQAAMNVARSGAFSSETWWADPTLRCQLPWVN